MPNWCSNTLCLQHEDPEMIKRAAKAFEEGRLLDEFIPIPQELHETTSLNRDANQSEYMREKYGASDWYDFAVNNWGTKWDVGGDGYTANISNNGHVMSVSFDSAWSPPIAAYEKFEELGFCVTGMYYESGMCYAGMYDECGDEYYDLSNMDSAEVRDSIPAELDNVFCISETMEEYEREEQDEVTTWYKDGVEETGLKPHEVDPKVK